MRRGREWRMEREEKSREDEDIRARESRTEEVED